jgi:hypothetical protein
MYCNRYSCQILTKLNFLDKFIGKKILKKQMS